MQHGATTVAGTLAAAVELDSFGAVPLREAVKTVPSRLSPAPSEMKSVVPLVAMT